MGEIINLRRVKRVKAKVDAATVAAENRARHGRSKAEREAEALRERQAARLLDGARLPPAEGQAEE